jgi:hypothetical protein
MTDEKPAIRIDKAILQGGQSLGDCLANQSYAPRSGCVISGEPAVVLMGCRWFLPVPE